MAIMKEKVPHFNWSYFYCNDLSNQLTSTNAEIKLNLAYQADCRSSISCWKGILYFSNPLADLQHIVPLHIAWLLVLIEASGSNKKQKKDLLDSQRNMSASMQPDVLSIKLCIIITKTHLMCRFATYLNVEAAYWKAFQYVTRTIQDSRLEG